MNARTSLFAAALAAAASLGLPNQADAAVMNRVFVGNATAYCQSALPVFDARIRKRPLAVQNDGSTSAYVTCSFPGQFEAITGITINFASDSPASLTCTGVSGTGGAPARYSVKSVDLVNNWQYALTWEPYDFADTSIIFFSVSCNLPPGVGIQDSYISFTEDVGQ